jgi:hypothetical protein
MAATAMTLGNRQRSSASGTPPLPAAGTNTAPLLQRCRRQLRVSATHELLLICRLQGLPLRLHLGFESMESINAMLPALSGRN